MDERADTVAPPLRTFFKCGEIKRVQGVTPGIGEKFEQQVA